MYGMTHFVYSVERGLSVTVILITLPHGQHMQKWSMINFYAISPHRKYTRQTALCLVQPQNHSCLKSVPKHEWKRSSHTQSDCFPKGSNCSVFSNFIPLCPRFLFPLGARHLFITHRTPFSYLWGRA